MDSKTKPGKDELEGEDLGIVKPSEPVQSDASDKTASVITDQPAKSETSVPKESLLTRITQSRHLYLGIFLALLLTAIVLIILTVVWGTNNVKKSGSNGASLSSSDLAQLSSATTVVGDSKQTLDVQGAAIFEGQVLTRGDLNVAGAVKAGGVLSAPTATLGNGSFTQLQINDTLSVSGSSSFQSQVTVQKNLTVTGSGSFGSLSASQLSVGGLQFSGDLTISKHITTGGGVPGKSNGSALGGGGTVSVNGSDTAGTVTINTGSGPAAGCFVTISFVQKYGSTPHVVISPSNSSAGSLSYYTNRSNTNFSICSTGAPAGGANYIFDYIVFN